MIQPGRRSRSSRGRAPTLALALGLAGLLTGCAYRGGGRDFDRRELNGDSGWVVVGTVPLLRQDQANDCGPAALAMVLRYWGLPATPEEIRQGAGTAGQTGGPLSAGELRDFARRNGLQAFLVRAGVDELRDQIRRSRPVLVGLIQPYAGSRRRAHYAVVIGFHPGRRQVLTLDPARGWRVSPLSDFLAEWEPSQRLALIAYR